VWLAVARWPADAAAAGLHPGRALAREVALLTAHAMCSAAAGSRSERHRRRCFPQALGASPPWQDADAAGQQQWRALARQAALRGKRVAGLPPGGVRGAQGRE